MKKLILIVMMLMATANAAMWPIEYKFQADNTYMIKTSEGKQFLAKTVECYDYGVFIDNTYKGFLNIYKDQYGDKVTKILKQNETCVIVEMQEI